MTRHQQQVLVVSELHSIYSNIQRILTTQGLRSTHIQTVDKASIAIEERQFHIIILDSRLPQSTDFYQHLRHTLQLPILVLTENNSATDGVSSIINEDDCLHQSFESVELIDAVRTVRQRCNSAQAKKTPSTHLGPVKIDIDRFEATRNGEVIRLTRTEWALLEQLASHANTTLTHQILLQRIWGDAYVDEHSYLHTYMRRLRRKLEPDPANPCYLVTDVGIGYRLMVSQNSFGDSQDSSEPAPHSEDTPARSHQLTAPPTSFLGRERDLNELQKLLENPNIHLLTLTGPPGVGKTRLALHLVEHVRDRFTDGAHVISLAPLQDSALVISTVAQALEIKEVAQQPIEETLKQTLQNQEMLLLLDNFEHVLEAAPVLIELITTAPHLTILVTSRTSLRVAGEQEYLVAPLAMPDVTTVITKEIVEANPAVQLFVQRSQSVKADFALTEENAAALATICLRLDGLPLAIELAAARSKLFTPESLLARLDERLKILTRGSRGTPERHQTLRAALEWSYNLLTTEEQQVLMGLSVFAGGCTLEAATAVLNSEQVLVTPFALPEQTVPSEPIDLGPSTSFLDKVASLVDHSLIQVQTDSNGESRFTLLETIREYALEKLQESGNLENIQHRYAEYYLWFVEKTAPKLERAEQQYWFERLESDYDNIRSILRWCLIKGKTEIIASLAVSLWKFWYSRGYFSESQKWVIPSLENNYTITKASKARFLMIRGFFVWMQGNRIQGQRLLEESLLAFRDINDTKNIILSLYFLGWLMLSQRDYNRALDILNEGLLLSRQEDDEPNIARIVNNLGGIALEQYQLSQAENFFNESLVIRKKLGDKQGISICLSNLAIVELRRKNYKKALQYKEDSLLISHQLKYKQGIALTLIGMGNLHLYENNLSKSRMYYNQSLNILYELTDKANIIETLKGIGLTYFFQNKIQKAIIKYQSSLDIARELNNKTQIVSILISLGHAIIKKNDHLRAKVVFRECLTILKEIPVTSSFISCLEGASSVSFAQKKYKHATYIWGYTQSFRMVNDLLDPLDNRLVENYITQTRAHLDEATWQQAWEAGQKMSLEEAIDYALEHVLVDERVVGEEARQETDH